MTPKSQCPRCGKMESGAHACRAKKENYQHDWSKDGERCAKCGDKDWMGGPCSKPDVYDSVFKSECESFITKHTDQPASSPFPTEVCECDDDLQIFCDYCRREAAPPKPETAKGREFLLYGDGDNNPCISDSVHHPKIEGYVWTVEKSAYEKLERELSEANESNANAWAERDMAIQAGAQLRKELDEAIAEIERLKTQVSHARNMEQVAIGHKTSDAIINNCERRDVERALKSAEGRIEKLREYIKSDVINMTCPEDNYLASHMQERGRLFLAADDRLRDGDENER